MRKKVTVYTQVYNTKPFLEQCIHSVLSQTYTNFEYILVDNGCTDGSSEIIEKFAGQDSRIKLIQFSQNQVDNPIRYTLTEKYATGTYFSILDSDDWWDTVYLEKLVDFLEQNDLDLAVTGTLTYFEAVRQSQALRKLEQPVVLSRQQFAQRYQWFWTFPSTYWASVMKTELYKKLDYRSTAEKNLPYGTDTTMMLQYIKLCDRIGIDNSALYHYRIHPKGVSYQYNPRRFDANIDYYEQIKEFLELHNTLDSPKREWLKRVHLESMCATLELLQGAQATQTEQLTECARIAAHPLTAVALSNRCDERERWFALMRGIISPILSSKRPVNAEELQTVFQVLSPQCYRAVQARNLGLFAREPILQETLQKDDRDGLISCLMELICQKQYSKQYDLGQMLCALIPPGTPLEGMTDTRFFREYAEVCMFVLCENYTAALEQMTGLLFNKKKLYATERFLTLYISLAALEEQAPAFVFGKLQQSYLYLAQGRMEECRDAVDELTEMGVENEELDQIRWELEERR